MSEDQKKSMADDDLQDIIEDINKEIQTGEDSYQDEEKLAPPPPAL